MTAFSPRDGFTATTVAGYEGSLIVRAAMAAHTRHEVDQMVITAAIEASVKFGRPVTGNELLRMWDSAHRGWLQTHPSPWVRFGVVTKQFEEQLRRVSRVMAEASSRLQALKVAAMELQS